jgi:hypothetical protein
MTPFRASRACRATPTDYFALLEGEECTSSTPTPTPTPITREVSAHRRACAESAVSAESPPARSAYAHPWPDELPGLGPRQVGPFIACAQCAPTVVDMPNKDRHGRVTILSLPAPCGTWVRYGVRPLCLECARARDGARL